VSFSCLKKSWKEIGDPRKEDRKSYFNNYTQGGSLLPKGSFRHLLLKADGEVLRAVRDLLELLHDEVELFHQFVWPRELPELHCFY